MQFAPTQLVYSPSHDVAAEEGQCLGCASSASHRGAMCRWAALSVVAAVACCCQAGAATAPPQPQPQLAVVGKAEVVWNGTRDACFPAGPAGRPTSPDSLPVAWHDPLTNTSSLISACYRGTFPATGPNLSALGPFRCDHNVLVSVNDSRPWSYTNFQWLQSVRVFPNGSGFAMIHNEFHGELSRNLSYCSHYGGGVHPKTCIQWSTDIGASHDGGSHWHTTAAPVFALPRPYLKDGVLAGYGALGGVIMDRTTGWYYGHVYRSYRNGTGAGPPGTAATGVCAWRSRDPRDPASFRGWNGTAWSTEWVDPYRTGPIDPAQLWRHTCASIDTGGDGSAHPDPKVFAGAWRPAGWPTHVMLGWPSSLTETVSYAFLDGSAAPGTPAPFTAWATAQYLSVSGWLDPHTLRGLGLRYPALIDHDSPFGLAAGGDLQTRSEGLSYALVGNASLHLYLVLGHLYIVRLPVAWLPAGAPVPRPPFPPLPPVPRNCSTLAVEGAGLPGVDGVYRARGSSADQILFSKDSGHQLYCLEPQAEHCAWRIAHNGHPPLLYIALGPSKGQVPAEGWATPPNSNASYPPYPTVACRPTAS